MFRPSRVISNLPKSAKDLVNLDHLWKYLGTTHTPENFPIVEKTMEDLEASYNEMLADDKAGGDFHKTEGIFMNKSFIRQ